MGSIYLVTGDVNVDHLVNMVSSGFFHCKVTICPFATSKHVGWAGALRLC